MPSSRWVGGHGTCFPATPSTRISWLGPCSLLFLPVGNRCMVGGCTSSTPTLLSRFQGKNGQLICKGPRKSSQAWTTSSYSLRKVWGSGWGRLSTQRLLLYQQPELSSQNLCQGARRELTLQSVFWLPHTNNLKEGGEDLVFGKCPLV